MRKLSITVRSTLFALVIAFLSPWHAAADADFEKLFSARKFGEALAHADSKIPNSERSPELWVKIGQANEAVDFAEKALASYLVAWRLKPDEYQAVLGAARIYNKMEQYDNAASMAEEALKVRFTAEASWEFARACIALKRPEDARAALEKVINSDPENAIANRELGNIYFANGEYALALPLMKRSLRSRPDGRLAFRIGRASFEAGESDSALVYLKQAADIGADASETVQARAVMARIFINKNNCKAAIEQAEILVGAEPNNVEYLRMLADCYNATDVKDKLAVIDGRIILLDKKDVPSRIRLADYAISQNDLATAQTMLREAAALDPRNDVLHRRIANVARDRKQLLVATAAIREYIKLKPNDAEAQRDLGDLLYEQKNYDGALTAYRAAIRLDPNLRGFHKRYAEIVIARGQTNEVLTTLNTLIKNGEADASTYITLGSIHHSRKQFREAANMFREAIKLEPSNMDALVGLGQAQIGAGDINGAVITFEQAVMMNPDAVQEHKTLGELYTRQKKLQEAIRAYIKYLEKSPDDRTVSAAVGRQLFEDKKFADAAKYLAAARITDPPALMMLAEAYIGSDSSRAAIPVLEDLRNRRPRVPNINRVMALLADAYEKNGETGKAALAYAEYSALPGVKDREASYKAAFLQEKDNPANAIRIYEANVKAFPDDIRNSLRLGLLYSQRNELAKALPHLQRSTALADKDPPVWLQIAKVYEAMGRDENEIEALRRYLRADAQHVEANVRLGSLLLRRGDNANAMVHLEIANTMSPNDPNVLALLARGYIRSNRNSEAINVLTRAISSNPGDADLRYQLYQLYVAVNDKDKAFETIKALYDQTKETRFMLPYGEMLISQGNVKDAQFIADELLIKDPENIHALMLNARVLRADRKFDEAIEMYKLVNDLDPSFANGYYERAETFMQMSRPTWAETFYNRTLRADPQFGLAELGLALLYKSRNQMDKYKQHLENAKRLIPDDERVIAEINKQ